MTSKDLENLARHLAGQIKSRFREETHPNYGLQLIYALWQAKRLLVDEKGMGYGMLEGGATNNQSVMFLKIGDLVFTEWSHNGSLRAYKDGSPQAPSLYQRTYHGADLRAATSLDFHDAANMNPELRHMNSEDGTWQRKARDFIRRRTNVYINDAEIL